MQQQKIINQAASELNSRLVLVHLASDKHLEFSNEQPHSATDKADVIVLAGDIWTGDAGIHWARATWPDKAIIYVAGNHEFYRKDIHQTIEKMRLAAAETGVHFLENDEAIINGVRFLGCTLWTDFKLFGEAQMEQCMIDGGRALADFRLIRNGEWLFSPQDSIEMHQESVRWLEMKLRHEPFTGPTVVVTHHAPSWQSVVQRYQHDLVSACFASRLNHLLGFSALWLHGHMHDSLNYEVAGTRVLCNPRGYTRFEGGEENDGYDPRLLIQVSNDRVEVIPSSSQKYVPEAGLNMSARARDAAIWAIDGLQVSYWDNKPFVDLYALQPALLRHVRDIVLTFDKMLKGIPDQIAILPLAVDDVDWLVAEIVKRAPQTTREPRRRKA